jgi:hypothetical protein
MQTAGLNLTVEIYISDFLGVKISRSKDGKAFELTQPHLIQDVIKELRLEGDNVKTKVTPGASGKTLLHYTNEPNFDGHFDYRKVIGKLNYLEKCTRLDITCAVHQAARFVAKPKKSHADAVKWIGRYLKGTADKGMVYPPDTDIGFEVYVYASFSGDWNPEDAEWDRSTAQSRTGFVIRYASCPIIWTSKSQTEVALSTTESEYIAISSATREILPLIELIQELDERG